MDQESGALWYEESLPTETVLVSLTVAAPVRVNGNKLKAEDIFTLVEKLTAHPLQLGGKATVGYGVCSVRLSADK